MTYPSSAGQRRLFAVGLLTAAALVLPRVWRVLGRA